MANIENLNDEVLENAAGGAGNINTQDWTGAHWQATGYTMGTSFTFQGRLWYRIKTGDTLGQIAKNFGTTVAQLQANNPKTIVNPAMIFAGDAIVIRRV